MKLFALPLAGAALLAATFIAIDTGAQSTSDAGGYKQAPKEARLLASAQNEFGNKLMRELHEPGKNTFISATSITQAMQMALLAADGETRKEMIKVMGLEGLEQDPANRQLLDAIASRQGVKLSVANSVWGGEGRVSISDEFLSSARKFYDAEARVLDFDAEASVGVINTWVSEKTQGKITKLLDRIPPAAVAYIVNAVYFKGTWAIEFNKENTRDGDFTIDNGSKLTLPMMNMRQDLHYGLHEGVQYVRLNFKGDGSVGMWIALPAAGKLDDLVGKFDGPMLAAWRKNLSSQEVVLKLPRFKLGYNAELVAPMQKLGMNRAFDANQAEFPKMQGAVGNVFISRIIHKTILEVNEEGAEAAAVTGVEMQTESVPAEPTRMYVDRPFFVAIIDDATGAILFQGAVHQPEALAAK